MKRLNSKWLYFIALYANIYELFSSYQAESYLQWLLFCFRSSHIPLLFSRFLRHVPVIYVDYPGATSLTQIYGTFNRAMLRVVPSLRAYAQPLTDAMVEFYSMSQVNAPVLYLFICMSVPR